VLTRLHRLPKAELHVHLDGSVRPSTLLELARSRGVPIPADSEEALAYAMVVGPATSLEEYLERFSVTLALMQDAEALERIAYELAEDHAAENVRYVEVRFCPPLSTEQGLTSSEVLDAVLAGLTRASSDFGIVTGVIISALRSLSIDASHEMAEHAIAYRERGVCGLDLAGAEAGHPVSDHVEALRTASLAGVPITIHAGEGFGPDSIREAIELGGASRIGHGTRLIEDPELLQTVREAGIPLEVCLTSNVQTGVVSSYATHPIRRYFDEGIPVCLCTDNRLMSGVTLTREYEHAQDQSGFSWAELTRIARMGFEKAFVSDTVRDSLLELFDSELAELA
jgi:adenosine deaminase